MALNYNRIIIGGRLCADPENKQTTTGSSIVRVRVAVERPAGKGERGATDFLTLTAFGATAEHLSRWWRKGDGILVEGRLHVSPYDAKDGQRREFVEVMVDRVYFVGKKSDFAQQNGNLPEAGREGDQQAPSFAMDMVALQSDDDLPF